MCCRYYYDPDTMEDIWNIVDQIQEEIKQREYGDVRPSEAAVVITAAFGDESAMKMSRNIRDYPEANIGVQPEANIGVRPETNMSTHLEEHTGLAARIMYWGFLVPDSKQLLINARSETAVEKPTFRESIARRRCIIPASKFYEWNQKKEKSTFARMEEGKILYMAGFYEKFRVMKKEDASGKTGQKPGPGGRGHAEYEDRFIILTTEANASMRPVHDRMPLILEKNQIEPWIYQDEQLTEFLKQSSPELARYQEYEQLSLFDFV